jgi:hypothetical protein
MPLTKLQFRPGINRDQTNLSGEGGWWDSDKIRFFSGYPQKLGGWVRYSVTPVLGLCRQVWNWITSYQDNLLALGTSKKLYVEAGGNFFDITPIRDTFVTPDTDNCFTTVATSNEVLVTINAHGATDGSFVTFSGATAVGGIPDTDLNKEFSVFDVTTSTFKIATATSATSSTSGGGTGITAVFQINVGFDEIVAGYGWGTDVWGRGAWGSGSTVPIFFPERDWWFDNFDNDLVANITNGPIYYWARGVSVTPDFVTRAVLLSSLPGASAVPEEAMQILISQNDKHLLAFGCTPLYSSGPTPPADPLLIRWADQDNPTEWFPSPTNSAGFLRVSRGSKIVRALPTRQEILVWTDSNLYALQFLGTTDVFGLQEYADNISIISARAVASASNITYWMGREKFYAYTGRVETLPCTVRNYVFNDLNYSQTESIVCGTNEGFNEVWWFYPSKNSNINDRYVIYNHLEKIWCFGELCRSAWLDSSLRQYPQALCFNPQTGMSMVFDHERGVDDGVEPMVSFIESNNTDLEDGDTFILTKRIIPDIAFDGSNIIENSNPSVMLEIRPRNFPGAAYHGTPGNTQPVIQSVVDQYTNQVFIRARARQIALKVMSSDRGVQWQLGALRLDGSEDGKR